MDNLFKAIDDCLTVFMQSSINEYNKTGNITCINNGVRELNEFFITVNASDTYNANLLSDTVSKYIAILSCVSI